MGWSAKVVRPLLTTATTRLWCLAVPGWAWCWTMVLLTVTKAAFLAQLVAHTRDVVAYNVVLSTVVGYLSVATVRCTPWLPP
jgi:hypothetical protein